MNDPNLNNVLKWGIENSSASRTAEGGPQTELKSEAIAALFAAAGKMKSDLDLMKDNMAVIQDVGAGIENRKQAFENFEMLIQNLDNANTMEPLGLWTPLVKQLESEHAELRELAAWCCSTAVQNNIRTQERLLIVGAIPTLVRLATQDTEQPVRKKAINALSSSVRNFQPALDVTLKHMPSEFKPQEKLDANDMESVDILINKLRESI